MMIIILCITFLYVLLIGSFIYGFDKVTEFQHEESKADTKFSIIIPFRNEENNLPELLNSILNLKYPILNFEIIFIDDASNDASVEIIRDYLVGTKIEFKIIQNKRNSNSPKKDAITAAIELALYEWIVTTDADCILPKFWLNNFDNFINKNDCKLISAPVTYYNIHTFLDKFQTLDFLSLIGATIGSFGIQKPFMCNGANLAYKKDFFKMLNGFEGNDNISSGDDVFLLQKALKNNSNSVRFLKAKEAIVFTKPQPNFKSLKYQRIRWASKTKHYNNSFGKLTGFIVLLMNTTLIAALVFVGIDVLDFKTLVVSFGLKIAIDFMLLYKTTSFFNQKSLLKSYIINAVIYPLYCVYIALFSIFLSYKWKDRDYKI